MPDIQSCPKCSAVIPIRDGKTAKFCPKCGEPVAQAVTPAVWEAPLIQKLRNEPMTLPRPVPSPAVTPIAPPPVACPVSPPVPVDPLAEETTEIALRHWNWGALFLGPWWALAQRAYVAATIYFLIDGVLWLFFFLFAWDSIKRNMLADSTNALTLLGAIVFLITMLTAVPLAILGDAVALKHRAFRHEVEYRKVQRTWARWGVAMALTVVLPPALSIAYLLITVPHTPGGLSTRLLTAASQGNATEIRAVLAENREKYGVGATNLNFGNALSNAKFNGNPEAVKLLEEAAAQQQQAAGRTN